ncbi:RES domain-containing protein [Candidatus Poriferisodalis sp.]|uniref:RES domain-containing protein n=1 Tax=Candidatus Poriferisodalis sp. TaxID=3101277 RepID=UPI003B013736
MNFLTSGIGGRYLRVVDWRWRDPLDASHSARPPGGRWNPPGLQCLYLNADIDTARANALSRFDDRPVNIHDVDPASAPHLVEIEIDDGTALDAFTSQGIAAAGLPAGYPTGTDGRTVPRSQCQPIGHQAHSVGLNGVDCRSAAVGGNRELAWFPDTGNARMISRKPMNEWW